MAYSRFGIYYLPPAEGALAGFGARWLGWDVQEGRPAPHHDVAAIAEMTATPRKYGFHGTLKPPFRLAKGCSREALEQSVAALAADLRAVDLSGLEVAALGRFLALVPREESAALGDLAARIVQGLDGFRAPLTDAELDRRRGALTARQEANLVAWGYPYVLEDFRFHLTLTGKLPKPQRAQALAALAALLPDVPRPFRIGEIALVGERADGMFETLHRYALSG